MNRVPVMVLLAALALTAHGAGGGDGMGGTGAPVAAGGDGIGGTGAPVRLALLGTIKAFGSIFVNGVKVEYNDQTPVSRDSRAATPGDLALGQVVEVEAEQVGASYHARAIRILTALEGPVTQALPQGGLKVLDRPVALAPEAHVQGPNRRGAEAAADFTPGQRVRVSGFVRADGVLQATRLEPAPAGPDRLAPEPVRLFQRQHDRISIEGYVQDARRKVLRVGDQEIALPWAVRIEGGTRDDIRVNRRVIVEGAWKQGGRLAAERIRVERPGPHDREDRVEPDHPAHSGRGHSGADPDHAERAERSERTEPTERAERPERTERVQRQERAERSDRAARPEREERSNRADRPEKSERGNR